MKNVVLFLVVILLTSCSEESKPKTWAGVELGISRSDFFDQYDFKGLLPYRSIDEGMELIVPRCRISSNIDLKAEKKYAMQTNFEVMCFDHEENYKGLYVSKRYLPSSVVVIRDSLQHLYTEILGKQSVSNHGFSWENRSGLFIFKAMVEIKNIDSGYVRITHGLERDRVKNLTSNN